jgi:hypothetical protein
MHQVVRQACGRGRGRGVAAAAALAALTQVVVAADSAALAIAGPPPAGGGSLQVAVVVAGIVSYTRWPAETRPIRLCTLGRGLGVDELLGVGDLGSGQLSVPVRAASVGSAGTGCDVIYVGTLSLQATRDLLQGMVGRPVLMIGEGREFCSDGGMFCLQPGASASFAVNLDAVARSGLRVNPWVLRIARNAPASGR